MDIRYYIDADTEEPHIYGHGVTESEVEEVLRGPGEDLPGTRSSRLKLGQTAAGRYLQAVYVPDEDPQSVVRGDSLRTTREKPSKRFGGVAKRGENERRQN